jgi:pseudouridine-5'-phosphate glycosidase
MSELNIASGPTVALESTVISHGLPYPQNLELAQAMEAIIRAGGAEPRTVAILGGELLAGLSEAQLHHLATAPNVRKVSRRDLPIVVAQRGTAPPPSPPPCGSRSASASRSLPPAASAASTAATART